MARRYLTRPEEVIDPADVRAGRWGKYAGGWAYIERVDGDRVFLRDWYGVRGRVAPLGEITHVADPKDPGGPYG